MIERIDDMPAGTIGFRANGKLTREDYRNVLEPILREAAESGEIRMLFSLTAFEGLEPAPGSTTSRPDSDSVSDTTPPGGALRSFDNDDTGMLVYTVLAGVNAHRSRMDGKKVKMGLERKFADGGSHGPARIGYLNTTEIVDHER
jgi:hypothetical protein